MIGRRSALLMAGLVMALPIWSAHQAEAEGRAAHSRAPSEAIAGQDAGQDRGRDTGQMRGQTSGQDADASPVVIELFTSQGCATCPPSDALLAQYADRDDVLALAFHVDYWDYLGWRDALADPLFTERQKAYARSRGKRMIYTPQMIVDGAIFVKGTHPSQLEKLVSNSRYRQENYSVTLANQGNGRFRLQVSPHASASVRALNVELVQYQPHERVEIERGENAGAEIDYVNIVRRWERLGTWDGQGELTVEFTSMSGLPGAVLLQRLDNGPIEAAARLPAVHATEVGRDATDMTVSGFQDDTQR